MDWMGFSLGLTALITIFVVGGLLFVAIGFGVLFTGYLKFVKDDPQPADPHQPTKTAWQHAAEVLGLEFREAGRSPEGVDLGVTGWHLVGVYRNHRVVMTLEDQFTGGIFDHTDLNSAQAKHGVVNYGIGLNRQLPADLSLQSADGVPNRVRTQLQEFETGEPEFDRGFVTLASDHQMAAKLIGNSDVLRSLWQLGGACAELALSGHTLAVSSYQVRNSPEDIQRDLDALIDVAEQLEAATHQLTRS